MMWAWPCPSQGHNEVTAAKFTPSLNRKIPKIAGGRVTEATMTRLRRIAEGTETRRSRDRDVTQDRGGGKPT